MTWNILCIVVKQTFFYCEHENEVPICVAIWRINKYSCNDSPKQEWNPRDFITYFEETKGYN